jgi:hypothetical protein
MSQITTCSFFKVAGFANKWWALKQMQMGIYSLRGIKGLTFFKILGSGDKNGFSSVPNFGTYVLLCVWNSEASAEEFFQENSFYKSYVNRCQENFTVYCYNAESHGYWNQNKPFVKTKTLNSNEPVLVLTRATIRLNKLLSFWRNVGKVSQSLDDYAGVALSIGVGEWPLIQQATISIWKTQAEMLDYAYKNQNHKEMVMLTRKLNWYKEELFARFVPYRFEGFWNGQDAQKMIDV